MIWIVIAITLLFYRATIYYLVSLTNLIPVRILVIMVSIVLPCWNILPAWLSHTIQCSKDGGIKIHEAFSGNVIVVPENSAFRKIENGFDGKLYCDQSCQSRVKGFFKGRIGKYAFKNNVAIESFKMINKNTRNTTNENYLYMRFWLEDSNDDYCIAQFYEPVKKKVSEAELMFANQCVAGKNITGYSTALTYVDKPFTTCQDYNRTRNCREQDTLDLDFGITKYGIRINNGKHTDAEVNTYRLKANTFGFIPVIKSHFCGFHENSYDFKEPFFEAYFSTRK